MAEQKALLTMTMDELCSFIGVGFSLRCYRLLSEELKEFPVSKRSSDRYTLRFASAVVKTHNDKKDFKRVIPSSELDKWIDLHSIKILEALDVVSLDYDEIVILDRSEDLSRILFVFTRGQILDAEQLEIFKSKVSLIDERISIEFAAPC